MAPASSPTTFADIPPHIIQTHILPRLDGLSLSTVATASSYLQALCADHNLWTHLCNSTWPSTTHPRVHDVITTFPAAHRSFFQHCFPTLPISQPVNHPDLLPHPSPSELISAVDIRYHNHIVYSTAEFTHTTTDFLSSALRIVLKDDNVYVAGISRFIDLQFDELVDADDATISHLKESLTLNWILIDPTRKRAGNLSSIKPVLAWITEDIHLRYVTVLPGYDQNEMVECRIEVRLGVGKGGVGLQVREVTLHIQDLACNFLNGKEFLVITRRAILEKNNTRKEVEWGCEEVGTKWRGKKGRKSGLYFGVFIVLFYVFIVLEYLTSKVELEV